MDVEIDLVEKRVRDENQTAPTSPPVDLLEWRWTYRYSESDISETGKWRREKIKKTIGSISSSLQTVVARPTTMTRVDSPPLLAFLDIASLSANYDGQIICQLSSIDMMDISHIFESTRLVQ